MQQLEAAVQTRPELTGLAATALARNPAFLTRYLRAAVWSVAGAEELLAASCKQVSSGTNSRIWYFQHSIGDG